MTPEHVTLTVDGQPFLSHLPRPGLIASPGTMPRDVWRVMCETFLGGLPGSIAYGRGRLTMTDEAFVDERTVEMVGQVQLANGVWTTMAPECPRVVFEWRGYTPRTQK